MTSESRVALSVRIPGTFFSSTKNFAMRSSFFCISVMLRLLRRYEINKRGIFGDQIGYGTWISASPPTHCFVHPSTVFRPDPCLEAGSGSQESDGTPMEDMWRRHCASCF